MSTIINSINAVSAATSAITTASAVVTPESLSFGQKVKNFVHDHKAAVIGTTVGVAVATGGAVAVVRIKNNGKLFRKKSKQNEETATEEAVA